MKSGKLKLLVVIVLLPTEINVQLADDIKPMEFTRQRDVIYGRKHGMALTMDVFTPENTKCIGVIWVVSGSGRSDHTKIDKPSHRKCIRLLLNKGYTVFAVVHSSAPRFVLQEMVEDIHRAVRFVRFYANDFRIDPNHIGIAGTSAGGELSLLVGTAGKEGDPNDVDPVERVTSKVQAVGSYFAPTDWLDFDGKGTNVVDFQKKKYGFVDPSFVFYDFDESQRTYHIITDIKQIRKYLIEYSPISHVTQDDAPTLIIHGDADPFVPYQQSKRMIDSLKKAGVPSMLITRKGKGHGWANWESDVSLIMDWFDKYLNKKS